MSHELSEQQAQAVLQAEQRHNLFLTGSGGVGKSFVIQTIVDRLQAAGRKVYVTASTGIAAVNIGGITLHAWAGVGLASEPVAELSSMIRFRKKTMRRWQCDVLIIDEISMLEPSFFEKIDALA